MTYQIYTLEKKIKFLDTYKRLGSITAAAKAVEVHDRTCRYWVRKEQRLRDAYANSLSNNSSERTNHKLSLEEQLECIKEVEQGISYRKIAFQHNCSKSTIQGWFKRRDSLLALYYTQNNALEVEDNLRDLASTLTGVGDDDVPKDEITKDLTKKIRIQASEIENLKDKIIFLENLNKILQERTGPVKKKISSRQLNKAENQEEET
jgi:transposase